MQIFRFQELQPLLAQNGVLSLLVCKEGVALELSCRVIRSDLSELILICDEMKLDECLKPDQMVSGIFKCNQGIYGFHCSFTSLDTTSSEAIFKSPDHAWKIERRQFPRTEVDKTILCDEAHRNRDHFEPANLVEEARLVNICRTGLSVQTNVRITVGEHLYVLLDLETRAQPDSLCVVVWSVENQGEIDFDYTYGVRFVNVESKVLEIIEDFVSLQLILNE